MTALRRFQRTARAARPARRDPRTEIVPPVDVRRRRGPKPPDAIVASLGFVLRRELEREQQVVDAEANDPSDREVVVRLGAAWAAALGIGLGRLVAHARRGVVGALAGTTAAALAREVVVRPPAGAEEDITEEVTTAAQERARKRAGTAAMVAAALAALEGAVTRLHASLVERIARLAGASRYVWTTMRDELVRPLHRALEGTVQRWDRPPLVGLPDFHGHAGEAAGPCRCQAFPLVG